MFAGIFIITLAEFLRKKVWLSGNNAALMNLVLFVLEISKENKTVHRLPNSRSKTRKEDVFYQYSREDFPYEPCVK